MVLVGPRGLLVAPGRLVGLRVRLVVGLRRGRRRLVVPAGAARRGGAADRRRAAVLFLCRVSRSSENKTNQITRKSIQLSHF